MVERRPIVVQYRNYWYGTEDVYLPDDEPLNVAGSPPMRCQACSTDMPEASLFSFADEDGADLYLCLDVESCSSRQQTQREKATTSSSFIMDAVNRLTERVSELEGWRLSLGSDEAVPVVGGLARLQVEPPTTENVPDWTNNPAYWDIRSRTWMQGHTLARADARHVPMDDESVDLIVTSPPYWAQRSYTDDGGTHYEGQIGDEATFDGFLDNLIACTRDWARVLKPSGSIWVNLGDKYSTASSNESRLGGAAAAAKSARGSVAQVAGMKPKSLLGLPWRYALRVMDELGLILREEVIWSKPNGMPESVTDRCRRSHEQWFHFTKNPTYYSAVDRIRLQDTPGSHKRGPNTSFNPDRPGDSLREVMPTSPLGALPPSVWEIATAGLIVPEWVGVDHYAAFPMELPRRIILGFSPQEVCTSCGEGRRPVKTVVREGGRIRQKVDNRFLGKPKPEGMSPQSQDAIGAHAGYKTWHNIAGEVCACTPYTDHAGVRVGVEARAGDALVPGNTPRSLGAPAQGPWREYHLEDWEPPPARPGVVLDPFGGTGTTALVAEMHGRHGVHLDLSADYLRIAEWRTNDPAQRASALQVAKPPVQMPGQMNMLDLLGDNGNDVAANTEEVASTLFDGDRGTLADESWLQGAQAAE